ncbi:MAG TPA: ATP-binding protein, partial [Aciduliprofundum sp.]|nr:ATP-binding protein [Aciduliprofundum sp.]
MLFDLRPKEKRGDLFDREKELDAIVRGLECHPIVLVLGPRRVGKTSLIRVAVGEASTRHVILDVRSLYFEHGPVPKSVLA